MVDGHPQRARRSAGYPEFVRDSEASDSSYYLIHEAPRPLEQLWCRPDLGCVQMCGYPIALRIADVVRA